MTEGGEDKRKPEDSTVAPGVAHGESAPPQVFISYASADGSVANAVCTALEHEGLRCWIAPRNVIPGEMYAQNIVRAIDTTRVVVLILSQSSVDSAHVLREVERACSKRHPILSFRIDRAPLPEGLQYFLNTSQWLDASNIALRDALPRLVDAAKAALGRPASVTTAKQVAAAAPTSKKLRWAGVGLGLAVAIALAYAAVERPWLSKSDATPERDEQTQTSVVPAKAIAVLPFVNMSSDKEQEYFSDGLSEEMLNLLAKIPELRVAARTSSFYYKGKDIKLADIARELNVAHLLEGSVRRSGERVRITAQLIRASDGYHVWSETYDRTLDDVFAIQEEIAAAVVSKLKITLFGAPPKVRKTTPDAYSLYLQAVQLDRQNTGRHEESIALYNKVLAIDPNFTPALFGLGTNYAQQAHLGATPIDAGMQRSREVLQKALSIDPEYGVAHAGLGWLSLAYDRDLAAAARHFERALELSPTDVYTLSIASSLNEVLGRWDADVAVAEYLISRDPMDPVLHSNLSYVYLNAGRLDETSESARAALKLSPSMIGVHGLIGDALYLQGKYQAALVEYKNEPLEATRLGGLAMSHFALGDKAESDLALKELIAKHPDWSVLIACVYALRDEADHAFDWLHEAVARHDSSIIAVATTAWLRNLHDDPRWLPLMQKIGMTPEQRAAIKFEVKVPTH